MRYLKIVKEFQETPIINCPLCESKLISSEETTLFCPEVSCEVMQDVKDYALAKLIDDCATEEAKLHKKRHEDFLRRYADDGR